MVIEGRYVIDQKATNLWADMFEITFGMFINVEQVDPTGQTDNLGIVPLKTGIWAADKLALLSHAQIKNRDFIEFLEPLSKFQDDRKVMVPINYGALDVEELGSIYEGLLDLKGELSHDPTTNQYSFKFVEGKERSNTGSHYTPESLVQPLLQHSLDHLIQAALIQPDKTSRRQALLDIRLIDPACGSGHILLSAARRLAMALAKLDYDGEQPDDRMLRNALRQVISRCVYGVDINPMALELCKMALWLEAHQPGQPLSFLDHHLHCGDALVGLVKVDELGQPIPNEAFTAQTGDDKALASLLKKNNANELKTLNQAELYAKDEHDHHKQLVAQLKAFNVGLERSAEDVMARAQQYQQLRNSEAYKKLNLHADALIAPFFIPKIKELKDRNYTTRNLKVGLNDQQGKAVIWTAGERKFLHWFLAFPDVMDRGGFDLVVGNPPFLGSQRISGAFGARYLRCLTTTFERSGAIDMVGYFFRQAHKVARPNGFFSFISTNTIAQGSTREGSLDLLVESGVTINHGVRSMRWPGAAAVEVALVTCFNGEWLGPKMLNQRPVNTITPYLDNATTVRNPRPLEANEGIAFIGSYVLGMGFVMDPDKAAEIIAQDAKYAKVLKPYLNGDDLNSRPDQSPSRWVINFYDWPLRRYTEAEWKLVDANQRKSIYKKLKKQKFVPVAPPKYNGDVAADYPVCLDIVERLVKPERDKNNRPARRDNWWRYAETASSLYSTISGLERVIVAVQTTKYLSIHIMPSNIVFSHMTVVIADDSFSKWGILNSSIHNEFLWKYVSRMGNSTLRYTPTDCFQPFPFPATNEQLEQIGQAYHALRQSIMLEFQVGLTQLYNLFHNRDLHEACMSLLLGKEVKAKNGKGQVDVSQYDADSITKAVTLAEQISQLRRLHKQIDLAVRDAYGWQDLDLGHDFHEVDYLPEHDRVRYTISEAARAVVLERLLERNLGMSKK